MRIRNPSFGLDSECVVARLGPLASNFDLRVVDECSSTNDVLARSQFDDDRIHVLVAHKQTAGRGRRGRAWASSPGNSLTFSCAWQIPANAAPPAGLSLAAGLAVADAIAEAGVCRVALKWPNDVLVDGCKLAGILVELSAGQRCTRAAVIGIGLNLANPPELDSSAATQATALSVHLCKEPDPNEILARILTHLHARLTQFGSGGFGRLRTAWQQRDAFAGRAVRITGEGVEHIGICDGVAEDGALLLRTPAGTVRILSGEVSLRIAA